jgi:hypothetical protein
LRRKRQSKEELRPKLLLKRKESDSRRKLPRLKLRDLD